MFPQNPYIEVLGLTPSTLEYDYLEMGPLKRQLRLKEVTQVGPNPV